MGAENVKVSEEVVLSEKDKVEFLNTIKSSIAEIEESTSRLRQEETEYKMQKYLLILRCLKEITPVLHAMENGRKCEEGVRQALFEIFKSIKLNNRASINKAILKLRDFCN